jgi:hypothetical protein
MRTGQVMAIVAIVAVIALGVTIAYSLSTSGRSTTTSSFLKAHSSKLLI